MTMYLGTDDKTLLNAGAIHTAREIEQQPQIWKAVVEQVRRDRAALDEFISEALADVDRILLTGAGTSAFIGLSIRGDYQRHFARPTEAVPSTDLVTHPQDYFHHNIRTLVISFARSGNSPESVAALSFAEQFSLKCFHLIITCNADGALARFHSSSPKYVFVLPAQANDQSLAMTSSYSGMLLAALLISRIGKFEDAEKAAMKAIAYGNHILGTNRMKLQQVAARPFRRAVFLGSGPLNGTAVEAHLKLQELTDGRIICTCDSFLGFRHGPKAVVDDQTLMVYFFSNNSYAFQYERDLLDDMKRGVAPMLELVVSEQQLGVSHEHVIAMPQQGKPLDESFLPVCFILVGQLLGYYKSLACGLRPDAPSTSGAITRVVQGVAIYEPSPAGLKINNAS